MGLWQPWVSLIILGPSRKLGFPHSTSHAASVPTAGWHRSGLPVGREVRLGPGSPGPPWPWPCALGSPQPSGVSQRSPDLPPTVPGPTVPISPWMQGTGSWCHPLKDHMVLPRSPCWWTGLVNPHGLPCVCTWPAGGLETHKPAGPVRSKKARPSLSPASSSAQGSGTDQSQNPQAPL